VVSSAAVDEVRPRLVQYFVSCTVLGIGVGLLLLASLGSDGYSTLVNGIALTSGVPFAVINIVVAAGFVVIAWARGLPPGFSTVVQPVWVGLVINAMLLIDAPDALGWRVVLLAVAFPVLVLGVGGYLGSGAGAGPFEAAVLSFDPPLPFRWSYSAMQGASALVGWALGASFGAGTALVIFLLGPAVDFVAARIPAFNVHASGKPVDGPGAVPCEQL
jgi:uncharacterized membrane protein YczE